MAWTDEDEQDFHRKRAIALAAEAEKDAEKARECRLGISPACPKCGSHRYVDATKVEECSDCGYSQSYW